MAHAIASFRVQPLALPLPPLPTLGVASYLKGFISINDSQDRFCRTTKTSAPRNGGGRYYAT